MPRLYLLFLVILQGIFATAQNVGIGTTTPLAKLHIKKDNESLILQGLNPYMSFYDNAGTYKGFVWRGPDQNVSIGTAIGNTSGAIQLYTNGSLGLQLFSGGLLDLNGSVPWLRLNDEGLRSGDLYGDGSNLEIAAYKSSFFGTPGNLILQMSDISQFQDLYAGNIGVGTRNPIYKFQVERDGWGIMQSNGIYRAGFYVAGGGGWVATQSFHPLYFCTGLLNGNNVAQMMIATNGNVGIGTLNPTYKLTVNGNVRTKEVVVETGWADYVFDPSYKLRSLDDVANHIKKFNHLPNIPSAKEIETNGLHVGEIQKKMMEKIEELTLYLIEANNQIKNLQLEVETLKKSK